jgi:hypothetical protein
MTALLDHELPGVDAPHRAVANDRRAVSHHDGLGHARIRVVPTLRTNGALVAVLRPVPFVVRDPRCPKIIPVHVHGDAA